MLTEEDLEKIESYCQKNYEGESDIRQHINVAKFLCARGNSDVETAIATLGSDEYKNIFQALNLIIEYFSQVHKFQATEIREKLFGEKFNFSHEIYKDFLPFLAVNPKAGEQYVGAIKLLFEYISADSAPFVVYDYSENENIFVIATDYAKKVGNHRFITTYANYIENLVSPEEKGKLYQFCEEKGYVQDKANLTMLELLELCKSKPIRANVIDFLQGNNIQTSLLKDSLSPVISSNQEQIDQICFDILKKFHSSFLRVIPEYNQGEIFEISNIIFQEQKILDEYTQKKGNDFSSFKHSFDKTIYKFLPIMLDKIHEVIEASGVKNELIKRAKIKLISHMLDNKFNFKENFLDYDLLKEVTQLEIFFYYRDDDLTKLIIDRMSAEENDLLDIKSPLCLAILHGNLNILKYLHSKFNINFNTVYTVSKPIKDLEVVKVNNEFTPLAFALYLKKFSIAQEIIELGGDINFKHKETGVGLLHFAIVNFSWDVAKFLIENDIDLSIADDEGNTAMHYLCGMNYYNYEGACNTLSLMRTHNADFNLKNSKQQTPWDMIMDDDASAILQFLTLEEEKALSGATEFSADNH